MKKIIPAMDLLDGNVVRLYKGDFDRIDNYSKRPVELLKYFFN
ncbi:MAG: HisA/HisF-related TIM barrel protein, partial [Promethearchaeota archaeon]